MGVGDVALGPRHLQPSIETSAPSDLDRLADPLGVGRLADDAVIRALALVLHPGEHLARAVDRRPFFIAGDEHGNRAVDLPPARLDIIERRGGEAGDCPLHVGGTPAVEQAAGNFGGEGWVGPELGLSRRHDVDMTGEAEMRRPFADAGVEIVDRRGVIVLEIEAPEGEAAGLQRLDQHVERAGVDGGHAFAADQALGELNGLVAERGHSVKALICNWPSVAACRMAIFCQTLRLRLVASISISLTASTTTGSSRSWA